MDRFFERFAVVRRAHHPRLLVTVHVFVWAAMAISLVSSAHGQILADGIAAVVNDKVITYLQINEQVSETEKLLRQNLQGQELMDRLREAKLNVLKALIDRELIIQDFKTDKKGIIPDTFVNARVDDEIRER